MSDPDLYLIGYQADFSDTNKGFYLFNHRVEGDVCNSTISIEVGVFLDLYEGPLYEKSIRGLEECPAHCQYIDNLLRCKVHCKHAYAREIAIRIHERLEWNRSWHGEEK